MNIEQTSADEGYVIVTEEEFLEQIAEGLCCGEVLKPGRHKIVRGGFRKRYPDLDPANAETRYNITLALPPEIYNHFKQQAEDTNAKSLAEVMEQILIEAAEHERKKDAGENSSTPAIKSSGNEPRRRAA
ncbi:MAG TPA: hypothetical protein PLD20_01500 [Blastocatellia bacterium]|nr:hypothetical protein [Blastocatellia bacterium]HMV83331.1 hypothetical protein [Blastocatellia bacterium]HMX29576.1 hypothetical protein [Blastocatellia bacterium]HMY72373.1 hypothetical protein [Blastocatellia bacterium]HMZ16612.1 hypothetical protein [Blastocatellia bacterium]